MAIFNKPASAKRTVLALAVGLAASAMLMTSVASAETYEKRLQNAGSGEPVMTGYGECWNAMGGMEGPIEACGDKMPEPESTLEVVATETAATMTAMVAEKITIAATMLFGFDSAELSDDAMAVIDERIERLRGEAQLTSPMRIEGHTDSTGPESYNQNLSVRRAQAVADYIAANAPNVSEADMEIVGMGESNPVASNSTREGRAQNRRVDIFAEGEIKK
jgi:OOP family OmpA-OmpF porin